jgi:hypothetical protein
MEDRGSTVAVVASSTGGTANGGRDIREKLMMGTGIGMGETYKRKTLVRKIKAKRGCSYRDLRVTIHQHLVIARGGLQVDQERVSYQLI